MNQINEDKWISLEDAANYMDVTKDTVRNWISKDKMIMEQYREDKEGVHDIKLVDIQNRGKV